MDTIFVIPILNFDVFEKSTLLRVSEIGIIL